MEETVGMYVVESWGYLHADVPNFFVGKWIII